MERVRRRKLCRNMKHVKRYFDYRKVKTTDRDYDNKIDKNVRCSHNAGLCHPYDDDIHWVHGLSDLLTSAEGWVWQIYEMFDPSFGRDHISQDAVRQLNNKLLNVFTVFYRHITEIYYADKGKEFCQEYYYLYRASLVNLNEIRETQVCGNYIKFADILVQKAKQAIASSRNKQERNKHAKKLKFFKAINRMKSIHRGWGFNGASDY